MLKPAFIDLSHHNVISESLVPAKQSGIIGVIHKMTESDNYTDSTVDNRYFLAKQAGLLWGLYHFVRPGSMQEQVDYFLRKAREYNVIDDATLLCLDWEDDGVSLDQAVEFMEEIEEETGRSPVLYSGHVLKEALGGEPDNRLSRYRLWLAQYGSDYDLPPGWSSLWGWQYTESGECPGINPPVDLNAYDGSKSELYNDWSGGEVEPEPEPEPEDQVEIAVIVPKGVTVKVVVKGDDDQ